MSQPICCVCHKPCPEEGMTSIGGRDFCAEHHKRAVRAGQFIWTRTGLIEMAVVVVVLLAAGWVVGQGVSPNLGLLLGLGVAAFVPAVFLVYIYHQDRLEPEPPAMVLGIFSLGALLGFGLAQPLGDWIYGLENWTHMSSTAALLGAICITGTLQEVCKYVAVRYTVYFTGEFDEPVDGIIYATAAGLGLATAINVAFVIENDGILTWAGCVFLASTTLLHVASGAVLGYGLGRQRFATDGDRFILPLCFLLAVAITGCGSQMVLSFGADGVGFSGTRALLVAVVFASIALVGTQFATTRLRRAAMARSEDETLETPSLVDPLVWGPFLLLLGTGMAYPSLTQEGPKDVVAFEGQFAAALPIDWMVTETEDSVEAKAFDGMGTALMVQRIRAADGTPVPPYIIDVEMTRIEDNTSDSGFGYRPLSTNGPELFSPHSVSWTEYAIARNPPGCDGKSGVLPVVYRGLDAFITTEKGGVWYVGLTAPADAFQIKEGPLADILQSLRVEP